MVLEISCAPTGEEKYPVPTTMRIARVFGTEAEAKAEFSEDQLHGAEGEYVGQNVYYLLWNTAEGLNLDREIVQDNAISFCGSWLPDSERIIGSTDLELCSTEKLRERAQTKTKNTKPKKPVTVVADDGNCNDTSEMEHVSNTNTVKSTISNSRAGKMAAWRNAW